MFPQLLGTRLVGVPLGPGGGPGLNAGKRIIPDPGFQVGPVIFPALVRCCLISGRPGVGFGFGLSLGGIEGLVAQPIGMFVLLAADVTQGHVLEGAAQFVGPIIQGHEAGVFYLVDAVHLVDHELAVAEDEQAARPKLLGMFQSTHQAGIFGDVIGGFSETTLFLNGGLAGSFDDVGKSGGAGIAAGAAVGVNHVFGGSAHERFVSKGGPKTMRLLILETSYRVGQVALAAGARLLGLRRLEESRRHARDLVPRVKELLDEQGWPARELTGVIVSRGPGSYTGLRVGIMSAKTLAYASGCTLVAVDTFAAIARQAPAETVDVLADAQQDKVYVQRFARTGPVTELVIQPFAEWSGTVPPGTWVSGPGLEIFGDRLPPQVRRVSPGTELPSVESLLALGLERLGRGEKDEPFALEPLYLRASAAEENFRLRLSVP